MHLHESITNRLKESNDQQVTHQLFTLQKADSELQEVMQQVPARFRNPGQQDDLLTQLSQFKFGTWFNGQSEQSLAPYQKIYVGGHDETHLSIFNIYPQMQTQTELIFESQKCKDVSHSVQIILLSASIFIKQVNQQIHPPFTLSAIQLRAGSQEEHTYPSQNQGHAMKHKC
ncbi:Hypothetical_protein [Hexamita inflata]|uniref:Hypothetical_protein n=1 Tax=Hexamita inflata TaxID=28002 RepID=A0AA86RHU6_9EUKA|nr:Hypothetical protein HINF_LOCUS29055 [Hexamita inflata]CAI9974631.1 Hypothetical protein HINF_LOCUS62276 [Hexamita inflata]